MYFLYLPIKKRIRKEGVTSDKSDRTQTEKEYETMTAKEFLNQAHCLNKLIQSHQRELSELEEMGAVISSSNFSGMPSGSRSTEAPFVRQVMKKIDFENQIRQELENLIDLKKQIHDAIDAVPDMNQRLVLRYRYIEFFPWVKIIAEMQDSFYSERQIYRFHSEGLKNIVVPEGRAKIKVGSACQ